MIKKKRVICAMSGGVDSSVAAAILKKAGYDVVGIFMKLWSDKEARTDLVRENICCSVEAAIAARAVAHQLKIPFYVVNLEKEFKKAVVDYYVKEYEEGRTPNPCVICNRDIKGEVLMRKALEMEADYLATGHYARIRKTDGEYRLLTSIDENKDQTYFLWTLTQKHLLRLLFPIGDHTKPDVRKIAAKMKLPTADRKESQGVCFIPDRDICGFLRRYAKKLTKPGPIVGITGDNLGVHDGLINYTIGQRERLGLGGPRAYYVVELNSKKNTLTIGDEKDLYKKKLLAGNLHLIGENKSIFKKKIGAKIRYGHPVEKCLIKKIDSQKIEVEFANAQRAITPGQSIVFYKGEEVLGGAVIEKSV